MREEGREEGKYGGREVISREGRDGGKEGLSEEGREGSRRRVRGK